MLLRRLWLLLNADGRCLGIWYRFRHWCRVLVQRLPASCGCLRRLFLWAARLRIARHVWSCLRRVAFTIESPWGNDGCAQCVKTCEANVLSEAAIQSWYALPRLRQRAVGVLRTAAAAWLTNRGAIAVNCSLWTLSNNSWVILQGTKVCVNVRCRLLKCYNWSCDGLLLNANCRYRNCVTMSTWPPYNGGWHHHFNRTSNTRDYGEYSLCTTSLTCWRPFYPVVSNSYVTH